MKVPVSSSPNIALHTPPTPTPTPNNIIINNSPSLCYEPTSVLDLRRSPTPEKKPTQQSSLANSLAKPEPEDSVQLDDHALYNFDWDTIMKDLGLNDDSVLKTNNRVPPEFSITPFDHAAEFTTLSEIYSNQNLGYNSGNSNNNLSHSVHDFNLHNNNNSSSCNWNNGFDFIEELIRVADCFDSNHLQMAQVILERLNQRLRSPVGKPLQRAAFYFKEALQSLLSGSNPMQRVSSMAEIVQTIRTFKAFSGISPIPMFSIFTTNQALLEALHGSSFMHVVDFDIGLGIQYASLMKEIAEKVESGKINSPLLRITAVVPEEYAVESRLVRENLNQFAHELRIRVQVEFVLLRTFETLSFKAVKFVDGEKTAVLLSPAIFRSLGFANNIAAVLADIGRVLPSVVVFVDGEGWTEAAAAASFRRGVVNSLEFYSMMLESLDASMVGGEAGGDWVRRIETLMVRPKILAAVEGAGRRSPPWREAFYGAGMRPVHLSQFADIQAQCLLAKVPIRGFHVVKRQAELVLFWHERAMVTTSAWRC